MLYDNSEKLAEDLQNYIDKNGKDSLVDVSNPRTLTCGVKCSKTQEDWQIKLKYLRRANKDKLKTFLDVIGVNT